MNKYNNTNEIYKDLKNNEKEVKEYLLNSEEELTKRMHYSICLYRLTGDNEFEIISDNIYNTLRTKIEITNIKSPSNNIGLGFLYMFDKFNGDDTVIYYITKKMINEIFSNIKLEEIIHKEFTSKDSFIKNGINKYLVNIISKYDNFLSSYISSNIYYLVDVKEKVVNIINTWDNYENKIEKKKYNLMINKVEEYLNSVDSIFTVSDVMYYIGYKLGIIEKIAKYDNVSKLVYESILENISDGFFIETTLNSCPEEVKHYNVVKNIMIETLFGKSSLINVDFKKGLKKNL